MYVAVGQSPLGPFPRVNSQLECQKQYTSLSSFIFLCSLYRDTIQTLKEPEKENVFIHSLVVRELRVKVKVPK